MVSRRFQQRRRRRRDARVMIVDPKAPLPQNAPLRRAWQLGIAAVGDEIRESLGVTEELDDVALASTVVRSLAADSVEEAGVAGHANADRRYSFEEIPTPPDSDSVSRRSFLGRLAPTPHDGGLAIREIDDLRTLVGIMRAGTLVQRKAAMLRLSERIADPRGIPSEQLRQATLALVQHRDVELSYELFVARSRLPGTFARQARTEDEAWQQSVQQVQRVISGFWDGELNREPIAALPADQRASLLLRARDLPERIVRHLCAAIEATDGVTERSLRLEVMSLLRYCADPRFVPSLSVVLQGSDTDLSIEAARSLGRIEDPRSRFVLRAAYERSVVDVQRAVIAGALGACGDFRGADYVRKLLRDGEPSVLMAALEAMETLGSAEDGEKIARFLEHVDPRLVAQAVRTLSRIGDRRVLGGLMRLRKSTSVSAVWAEVEDATTAIRARMELGGEEASVQFDELLAQAEERSKPSKAKQQDPALVRVHSGFQLFLGRLCMMVGAFSAALRRYEAAAARRQRWSKPLIVLATEYARKREDLKALECFRRAIEADRERLEADRQAMGLLALTFLRRAEQMEQQGRPYIANGLLEEALTLDLRSVSGSLRFELERRRAALSAHLAAVAAQSSNSVAAGIAGAETAVLGPALGGDAAASVAASADEGDSPR